MLAIGGRDRTGTDKRAVCQAGHPFYRAVVLGMNRPQLQPTCCSPTYTQLAAPPAGHPTGQPAPTPIPTVAVPVAVPVPMPLPVPVALPVPVPPVETSADEIGDGSAVADAANSTSSVLDEEDGERHRASPPPAPPSPPPPPKERKAALNKRLAKELNPCRALLEELEGHDESWPFLLPVNTKQFPTYRKIIRCPMDLSTIKRKLCDGTYKSREEFCSDVRLIFNNCETFNEDDSPVGKAGHGMRTFFEARWGEINGHKPSTQSALSPTH